MRKFRSPAVVAAAIALAAVAPARATFGGSNGRLLYQEKVGDYEQLFSVKPDGSGARQLTDFSDSDAVNASWSPDSKKIVFIRSWKGRGMARIYTMNADGGGLRELDRSLRGTPAWFPDGKHLLILKKLRWTIVTANGGAPRFAEIPGSGESPCISPDGKRVAFTASAGRNDGKVAILVAEVGGGPTKVQRITPWQRLADKIDCSPDGSKIVFSAPHFGPPQSSNVYVIGSDGKGLRQLTHSRGGKINNGANSWSPDGRKISFVSNRDGEYGVYTMNADGTGVTKLTKNDGAHLSSWGSHP